MRVINPVRLISAIAHIYKHLLYKEGGIIKYRASQTLQPVVYQFDYVRLCFIVVVSSPHDDSHCSSVF
jgi:hypothetical protein